MRVVGDARRSLLWTGLFERDAGLWTLHGNLQLVSRSEWPACLAHDGLAVATPDWPALAPLLATLSAAGVSSLVCTPPTLEELFLRHYDDDLSSPRSNRPAGDTDGPEEVRRS